MLCLRLLISQITSQNHLSLAREVLMTWDKELLATICAELTLLHQGGSLACSWTLSKMMMKQSIFLNPLIFVSECLENPQPITQLWWHNGWLFVTQPMNASLSTLQQSKLLLMQFMRYGLMLLQNLLAKTLRKFSKSLMRLEIFAPIMRARMQQTYLLVDLTVGAIKSLNAIWLTYCIKVFQVKSFFMFNNLKKDIETWSPLTLAICLPMLLLHLWYSQLMNPCSLLMLIGGDLFKAATMVTSSMLFSVSEIPIPWCRTRWFRMWKLQLRESSLPRSMATPTSRLTMTQSSSSTKWSTTRTLTITGLWPWSSLTLSQPQPQTPSISIALTASPLPISRTSTSSWWLVSSRAPPRTPHT